MTILFPIIYSAALTYLVWKAFKVMSNGWNISGSEKKPFNNSKFQQKKYTIHPELLDKSGNITSTLSNYELQMREYGLLDKLDTNRIGNEITIDQIREIISFTQISAHKNKKIVILNSASNMNKEASSALLKTLEEVSSNCTFILLASSLNSIAETIKSRCQVLQYERNLEMNENSNFQDFFFSKHPFLRSVDPDYNISNLTELSLIHI